MKGLEIVVLEIILNSKDRWLYVLGYKPPSSKVNSQNNIILVENDCIISDAEEVAKVFNEYFAEIADGIGFSDPIPDDYIDDEVFSCYVSRYSNHPSVVAINSIINSAHGTLSFSSVTSNEIYKLLMNMNTKKSTGYGNIPAKLLKIGAAPLAGILPHLLNMFIEQCLFPDELKFADVAALYKKAKRVRKKIIAVSILTSLSKVFESAFYNQLYEFFDIILSKLLSGFRKKYSCQTSLIRMIESWKSAIDSGDMVGLVAIDLSKAFDGLPHGLLIAKIHAYGVSLSSCKLIASYLNKHKQRVDICDQRSNWLDIERGVLQGSIIGPLLFNILSMIFSSSPKNVHYLTMLMIMLYPVLVPQLKKYVMSCLMKLITCLTGSMQTIFWQTHQNFKPCCYRTCIPAHWRPN